ncbi:MAG: hypothetical protein MJB14_13840, partial [Spirochaetes bacterium]|nr:hypothetical protein [Spirochaetota bacterium]
SMVNEEKLQYFKKMVAKLNCCNIKIELVQYLSENEDIYVLYRQKSVELIENVLNIKNIIQLKMIQQLFQLGYLPEQKKVFAESISQLITMLEKNKIEELIFHFMQKNLDQFGVIQKLIHYFFSSWKERKVLGNIQQQKGEITSLARKIVNVGHKYFPQETPVQSAVNIIVNDFKKIEVNEIMQNKKLTDEDKVAAILDFYPKIGSTNKAIIKKNPENQKEFLQNIIVILKK